MENKIKWEELEESGILILRDVVVIDYIRNLKKSLSDSFTLHREIQIRNKNEIDVQGVALNILGDSPLYLEFLQFLIESGIIKNIGDNYFRSKYILNSFSGLNNLPNNPNFSSNIHRDSKFFSNGVPLMLNMLVMLDDFTEENGPTLLLPFSHKKMEKPTEDFFYKNSVKALGKSGDILLFNSDIWHASSINKTYKDRMALPLTFSKSFIKQLMDYPRYLGYDKMSGLNPDLSALLGYNSRVASNLDEWYQPEEKRFYKKNQD